MSRYDHTTVREIVDYTEKMQVKIADSIETISDEALRERQLRVRNLDGIPVRAALGVLCDEVRKVFPHVKFGVASGGSAVWEAGVRTLAEVWAYMPGDIYAPVRIGFKDYSTKKERASQFGVYARHITNHKFKEDREQHHMLMSDNIYRALANVKRSFRPYHTPEVAGMSVDAFASHLRNGSYAMMRAATEAKEKLTSHYNFKREFQHMLNCGHAFVDASFAAAVTQMIEADTTFAESANTQYHGYYVQVRDRGGVQMFDVITVLDIKKASPQSIGSPTQYSAETLPEDIAHKLAALSMLQGYTFVEGLGQKLSDAQFWVLQ